MEAEFAQDLEPWGGAERMATVIRRRRHKGLVTEAFPGRFVEVTGRATNDPARRMSVLDLRVEQGPDGPVLLGPTGELTLYCGEDDHLHLLAFAPASVSLPRLQLGECTPRIQIGDVVVQRRRWELPETVRRRLGAAESPEDLLLEANAARVAGEWPRFVFAHSPSEPKPIFLDLDVPGAVDVLRTLAATGPVALVEMLPAPDSLWLRRSDGLYTSELRLALAGR
jgi:hypothetical protein